MDKETIDVEDLYIYSYCPYYYSFKGRPTVYNNHEVITAMLSRIMIERGENCYIGTRKYRAIQRKVQKYYKVDIPNSPHVNTLFKMMARVVSKLAYKRIKAINHVATYESVDMPVHLILEKEQRGRSVYFHYQYYYSSERPSQLRLHNDIRITGPAAFVAEKYPPAQSEVIWRNERFHIYKSAMDTDAVKKELRNLTAGVNHDIIYKRIGKWCSKCFLRGYCAKEKAINNVSGR